jgi:glycosyltransferase A (GT-A) superfamily protein (DUF2064 family)
MAKAPVAGRVKTRLCPPCSPLEAAAVAEAALADTLDAVARSAADVKVVALDGRPGRWLPPGLRLINQRGRGLAERLANAWADTRRWTGGWGIQIGMDTPQVAAGELDALLEVLRADQPAAVPARSGPARSESALLGLARDGGWWVIGLPGTDPHAVFGGVPMSSPRTGQAQGERLRRLGLKVTWAPVRSDIDTFDDLLEVAAAIPDSRTAAAAACIGVAAARRGVA